MPKEKILSIQEVPHLKGFLSVKNLRFGAYLPKPTFNNFFLWGVKLSNIYLKISEEISHGTHIKKTCHSLNDSVWMLRSREWRGQVEVYKIHIDIVSVTVYMIMILTVHTRELEK